MRASTDGNLNNTASTEDKVAWPELAGNGRSTKGVDRHRTKGSDELLIAALARGMTYSEAGEVAGVSERTARRRAADPEVLDAVDELRAEAVERATARLADTLDEAVGTLRCLLQADSELIRLRAANSILEQHRSMWEQERFERRLAAVEEAALADDGAGNAGWSREA